MIRVSKDSDSLLQHLPSVLMILNSSHYNDVRENRTRHMHSSHACAIIDRSSSAHTYARMHMGPKKEYKLVNKYFDWIWG